MVPAMTVTVRPLVAEEIEAALPALGRLRIRVFREWPYLYEGTEAHERDYVRAFARAEHAVLVAAFDDDAIVGAATASPMTAQEPYIRDLFPDAARHFYFGESVLLPDYRGRGIGHAFFDHREAQARACGAEIATFCGVVRPDDHPMRPADFRPLDPFWRARGYAPVEGLVSDYHWQDLGESEQSAHPMQFWSRSL
jgi:GNAT superfamily N-acetyltransferase